MKESDRPQRGIVLFDSNFGNTEKIAKSLAGGLLRSGVEVACINMRDVRADSLSEIDLIAIGGPTQMFTASEPMKDFLLKLGEVQGLKGKSGFAFDTKFRSPIAGSAAKFIESRLTALGMKMVRSRQSAIVQKTEGRWRKARWKHSSELGSRSETL